MLSPPRVFETHNSNRYPLYTYVRPNKQAHPDQLERIEDNFDMFYRNLLGKEVR